MAARLPTELIRQVYLAAESQMVEYQLEGHPDILKDRIRGLAVCRAWRRALEGLPVAHLRIDRDTCPHGFVDWLICAQPSIRHLRLEYHPELANTDKLCMLLHSLPRKELQVLEIKFSNLGHPKYCLNVCDVISTHPAAFPNLRELRLPQMVWWDLRWLRELKNLRRLQHLTLGAQVANSLHAFEVPRLTQITSLSLKPQCYDIPMRVTLSRLPSLKSLSFLRWDDGRLELVAGPHSSQSHPCGITHLSLSCASASVDFRALPTLRSMALWCAQLEGLHTVAQATTLTQLALGFGSCDDLYLEDPWVAEVLQHVPSSLRELSLTRDWSADVAAALSRLGQVQVLYMYAEEGGVHIPARGALWPALRALQLDCHWKGNRLPEGLKHATRLEALWLNVGSVSPAVIRRLASLPALKHLFLRSYHCLNAAEQQAAQAAVLAALPHLQTFFFLYEPGTAHSWCAEYNRGCAMFERLATSLLEEQQQS